MNDYIQEAPKLRRLTGKTKPPQGFSRYVPKDVAETIADYLQVDIPFRTEHPPTIQERATPGPSQSLSSKASFNQDQLDSVVLLYSTDPATRRALKGFGVDTAQPEPLTPSRSDEDPSESIIVPK